MAAKTAITIAIRIRVLSISEMAARPLLRLGLTRARSGTP